LRRVGVSGNPSTFKSLDVPWGEVVRGDMGVLAKQVPLNPGGRDGTLMRGMKKRSRQAYWYKQIVQGHEIKA